MAEKQITLPITGMHCANCASTIERSLKKLNGVAETNVNYATEKASVQDIVRSLAEQAGL